MLSQTKPNAAKETGGNLATLVALAQSMETMAQKMDAMLGELKFLNLQIAALSGATQASVSEHGYFLDNQI